MPVAFFFLFFTSQKILIKRSPNATKLYGNFLWTRRNKLGPGFTWVVPRRGQPTRARQEVQVCPGGFCPPRVPPWTASLLYKYPNITKTLGESTKYSSSRHIVQNNEIQSRHHHGGVHHFHWCLSDDA